MALIKTVMPEEATGKVKEMYDMMQGLAGFVPKPMQMMTASPRVFAIHAKVMESTMQQTAISPLLSAHIRLLVATGGGYPYCIDMNSEMLKKVAGLTDDQVKEVMRDPSKADLPEKDLAMLEFVVKATGTPEDVEQSDVDALRELGWTDELIFECVSQGSYMIYSGIMFNAFKMGI